MLDDVSFAISPDSNDPPASTWIQHRRLRVFTLTAAKPVLERLNHPVCQAAAEIGWKLAEGTASTDEVEMATNLLENAWDQEFEILGNNNFNVPLDVWEPSRLINVLALLFNQPAGAARTLIVPRALLHSSPPVPLLTPEETRNCCWLLREIFGSRWTALPSPQGDENWRTEIVYKIAALMYETQDFGNMPILADALQEAGCDHQDLLGHCRESGSHVRGCWVVDRVLGKGMNGPPHSM